MTKTLSEAYNDNGVINEGLITFDMNELAQYVTHTDTRIKSICESLEFGINADCSNVNVDKVNRLLSIREGNETLKIFLQKSLIEDMDNYFRKF